MKKRSFWPVVSLVVGSAFLLYYLIRQTSQFDLNFSNSYIVYADFSDASGIRKKTRLQISGIDIGRIDDIQPIQNTQGRWMARVTLRVGSLYPLYNNASIKKTSESILGDFRLSIDPGSPDHPRLNPGQTIENAQSIAELDALKLEMLQISHNVRRMTDMLLETFDEQHGHHLLKEMVQKINSTIGSLENTSKALEHTFVHNQKEIDNIVKNVGILANALGHIAAPRGDLKETSAHIKTLSIKLDRMADTVENLLLGEPLPTSENHRASHGNQLRLLATTPLGHAATMQANTYVLESSYLTPSSSLKNSIDNLNASLNHVNAITAKIDRGEGTLGKLVNDPGIANRIETALDGANSILGTIGSIETQIELRSEYGIPFALSNNKQNKPGIKNTLSLRVFPKPDKYYILEAISDPRGRQTSQTINTQVGTNDGSFVVKETLTSYNTIKFSAMFAKRYNFFTARFGIIENTGGLGFNLHFFHDNLETRFDAFDFSRTNPIDNSSILPRLRLTMMYQVFNHLFLQAGIDDPLNRQLQTWFSGGILRFSDEDLKAFLTIAPRF